MAVVEREGGDYARWVTSSTPLKARAQGLLFLGAMGLAAASAVFLPPDWFFNGLAAVVVLMGLTHVAPTAWGLPVRRRNGGTRLRGVGMFLAGFGELLLWWVDVRPELHGPKPQSHMLAAAGPSLICLGVVVGFVGASARTRSCGTHTSLPR